MGAEPARCFPRLPELPGKEPPEDLVAPTQTTKLSAGGGCRCSSDTCYTLSLSLAPRLGGKQVGRSKGTPIPEISVSETARGGPAFAFHVEGVFRGGADQFAVGEVEVQDTPRAAEGGFDRLPGHRSLRLRLGPRRPSLRRLCDLFNRRAS